MPKARRVKKGTKQETCPNGEDRSDLTNNRPTTERRRPRLQPGPAPGPTRKAIMEVAVGQPGCSLPAVRRSVKLRRRGRNKAAEQPLACAGRVPRAPPRPWSPRRNSRTPPPTGPRAGVNQTCTTCRHVSGKRGPRAVRLAAVSDLENSQKV